MSVGATEPGAVQKTPISALIFLLNDLLCPPPPSVPGGADSSDPGREAGARARGAAEGHGGEQQLQPHGRGEAAAEDGADRGEPAGLPGRHDGAPAGEGERREKVLE